MEDMHPKEQKELHKNCHCKKHPKEAQRKGITFFLPFFKINRIQSTCEYGR